MKVNKMDIVQKLTVKSMGWDRGEILTAVKKTKADGTEKTLIGRFGGIVTSLRQSVDAETGDIRSGLKGEFRGISSKGAVLTSAICYLPGGLQALAESSLEKAQSVNERATVEFMMDVFAIPDTNKAGYTFTGETIVEANSVDHLSKMFEEANSIKSLESPKQEK